MQRDFAIYTSTSVCFDNFPLHVIFCLRVLAQRTVGGSTNVTNAFQAFRLIKIASIITEFENDFNFVLGWACEYDVEDIPEWCRILSPIRLLLLLRLLRYRFLRPCPKFCHVSSIVYFDDICPIFFFLFHLTSIYKIKVLILRLFFNI